MKNEVVTNLLNVPYDNEPPTESERAAVIEARSERKWRQMRKIYEGQKWNLQWSPNPRKWSLGFIQLNKSFDDHGVKREVYLLYICFLMLELRRCSVPLGKASSWFSKD